MNKYKLKISPAFNARPEIIPLQPLDEMNFDNEFESEGIVFDNQEYSLKVLNENNEDLLIRDYQINDEWCRNEKRPFLDCYGVVRISVYIDGVLYTSPSLSVFVNGGEQNRNIEKMIDFIYNNSDNYLYENHSKNEKRNGVGETGKKSVQVKINILEEIKKLFVDLLSFFKNSPHTKLINKDKIASFEKLRDITPQTIRHIITHVDELQVTDINSGIICNKQYYQPKTTLVKSVHYTQNNYENQCVLGFLKELIKSMQEMQTTVDYYLNKTKQYRVINGYRESKYYIYRKSRESLENYHNSISKLLKDFKHLYFSYKKILRSDVVDLKGMPNFTPVFKKIKPYRQVFEFMHKWFNSGEYDLSKDELVLSFLSTSKIYEYYCLIKLKSALLSNGFTINRGYKYEYREDRYYKNTRYNNTFQFSKEDIIITLYYQPKVCNGNDLQSSLFDSNEILLYRNSSLSLNNYELRGKHCYYTPDYIIKISKQDKAYYWIMDAKFSKEKNIQEYQLTDLVWKYLFSISAVKSTDEKPGLIIFCGKSSKSGSYNYNDISYNTRIISPTTELVNLSALTSNEDSEYVISSLLSKMLI